MSTTTCSSSPDTGMQSSSNFSTPNNPFAANASSSSTPHCRCSNKRQTALNSSLGSEMDLIEVVNKLQNKLAAGGHTLKISLPQIVVVGSQSAGKSSVLENVVGREFLPRGSGVVTRRPTVVQLQPSESEEYAVFLHKENEKFYNFEEVKEEIRNETNRDPGPTGFSSKPISLKIYAPNVLKLTLVDLPGLIKNVVGNQSEDSIEEVRNMVLQYIRQPNSIILAVSPANQDIANSDALNIAKTVDNERRRTIGVLTKLDLMDDGTNALDILENKKIHLARGYVGVLNRSQKDIDEGKDIQYSLDKEKKFFKSNPHYCNIADRMGSSYLQKLLHQQLRTHIKESLPVVRKELSEHLCGLRKQLKEFENIMGYNLNKKNGIQFYMIKLVQKFIDDIHVKIFGHSELVDMKNISAGAIINYKLYTELQRSLRKLPVPSQEKLMVLIANMHGIRNTLSVSSLALEAVCGKLLSEYIKPLSDFVDSMADILNTAVEESASLLESYPTLQDEMLYCIRASIDKAAEETKDALEKHMKAEMYFVNIYHQDFKYSDLKREKVGPVKIWDDNNREAADQEKECGGENEDPEEERFVSTSDGEGNTFNEIGRNVSECIVEKLSANENAQNNSQFLATMIQKYMRIERKQIGDAAIKHVAFFLVKRVLDFIKSELIATLVESDNLESLIADCERDFQRKEDIIASCHQLEDALCAVQSF